jgi:hypothetical protein
MDLVMTDFQIVTGVSVGLCLLTWFRIVRTARRRRRVPPNDWSAWEEELES